jgi:hypothetical protein
MAFGKFVAPEYPRRQWLIEGPAGSGKSTFATQMRAPMLPIDADQRFAEVLGLVKGEVYQLSNDPADNIMVDKIAALLKANMPGSKVGTIVVDSVTAIITPLVIEAIRGNDQGKNTNRVAAFKEKATAMRLLQDVVTGWGTDVAWIYHLVEGRDAKAQAVTNTSISTLELSRLMRSVNLRVRLTHNGVWSATVTWARRGRSGMTIEDKSGTWVEMPEKIEAAVYDGLSEEEKDKLEGDPTSFDSPASALAWGMTKGVFRDEAHAKNVYEKVKETEKPKSAAEMWMHWIAEVKFRMAEAERTEEAQRLVAVGAEVVPDVAHE